MSLLIKTYEETIAAQKFDGTLGSVAQFINNAAPFREAKCVEDVLIQDTYGSCYAFCDKNGRLYIQEGDHIAVLKKGDYLAYDGRPDPMEGETQCFKKISKQQAEYYKCV